MLDRTLLNLFSNWVSFTLLRLETKQFSMWRFAFSVHSTVGCSHSHLLYLFSITRIRKAAYARTYPVRVINPDGSSYIIRHEEPIGVVRIPQDPDCLSEEEKKARMKRLKGEKVVDRSQDFEDDDVEFDQEAVRNLLRNKAAWRLNRSLKIVWCKFVDWIGKLWTYATGNSYAMWLFCST